MLVGGTVWCGETLSASPRPYVGKVWVSRKRDEIPTMKHFSALSMICVLVLGSCKEQSTQPSASSALFALYWLADSTITASEAWGLPIDSVSLSASPFLTQNDLTAYYWPMHSFAARPHIDSLFAQMRWLAGKSSGVPFVVVAMSSRIYVGAFWWSYSSSIPMGAYIDASLPSPYRIQRWQLASMPDMRSDQRIHDALKAAGVLVQ
jgi:hypothetical protein